MAKTTSKQTAKLPASRNAGSTGSSTMFVSSTNGQAPSAKAPSTTTALTTASAIEALKLDRRNVEKLFKEYE